ncbi:MAG: YfcE family phosphodiesterase [Halobacteriales archaeon]
MLVVLGDTHRETGHGLDGRTREAVRSADVVAHTGDFTTPAVHAAFGPVAERFHAVAGNNDAAAVASRLPARTVFRAEGLDVVVVHGHNHSEQALSLLGREVGADLVAFGHSHRPRVEATASVTLLNPGSHTTPRQFQPAHAELVRDSDRCEGRLARPDGSLIEAFTIDPTG